MRTPKAVQLLKLLNDKELRQLLSKLKQSKKKRLAALTNWLMAHDSGPFDDSFREKMFHFLFEGPYDVSKDYLLRNELRLVSEAVRELLTEIHLDKEVNQNKAFSNTLFMSALFERKAFDLFKLEYKDIYDQTLSGGNHHASWVISGLNYSLYARFFHEKETNLEIASQMNDLQLVHLSNFYVTAYRNYQANLTYLKHLKFPFLIYDFQKEVLDQAVKSFDNEFAAYLFKKAQSYLLPADRRIQVMEECLDIANSLADKAPIYQEEIKFCLSELAMLNNLVYDFDKADQYYQQFFELDLPPTDPFKLSVAADYIAKLLKQRRTEEAIEWIDSYQDDIRKIEKLNVRLKCLKAAAFAFSGDAEKLYQTLPENFADYSRPVRHFFRLHYAIHAWLNQETEHAIRELDNLLNVIQKGEPPVFDVRPVTRFMRRYFNTATMPKGQTRTKNLEKLQADLEKYELEAPPVYKSYLPYVWLKNEIDN
jgi:hypothetical protein